ncbi:hypothetical protein DFR58_101191 [Anaerobacterium chartisolvens]|uniref:DUF4435 domain-containing protein n=1 Tax=Anaerobacterium chartisolvens TaxID=1297424 RepID=A0A369BKJ0_9FIRM|nr:hypothetical protein [Anaerobacterium chartisolvens]RCX20987.1 hypothetical protein DFR58_101191 [Anaerobacterium chartisolvens]
MPIAELLVEGKIDAEIINVLMSEYVLPFAVRIGGTKGSLNTTVKERRKELKKNSIFYLRDRDFDYDVDVNVKIPQPIKFNNNGIEIILGWHWCRHEIENYLLQPDIVSAACCAPVSEVMKEIKKAAVCIRFYQAARWTIGKLKRKGILPPPFDLPTKPKSIAQEKKDFLIVDDCSQENCLKLIRNDANEFLSRVQSVLDDSEIVKRYNENVSDFSLERCEDIDWILQVFSGKDLFTSLTPWMKKLKINHPSELRDKIVSWIGDNPRKALEAIPEWQKLFELLQSV